MRDLVNEFSWSASRAAKFEACPRAYYYHYYASWGGWEAEDGSPVRELWILKKLTSRQAWAGSAVHDVIAWALERVARRQPLPPPEAAVDRLYGRMRREFVESRDGVYRRRKALGLVEHEYEEPLDDEVWRENWERARTSLLGFYETPVLREALDADPQGFYPIDTLDTFVLDGVKVYAAPDFAFRDGRGRLRIVDWKTGRPKERDKNQVLAYALFAMDRWEAPHDRLALELCYLADGPETVDVPVDEAALDRCRDGIRTSVAAMRSCLADVDANVPRTDAFEATADERTCARCNFRRACPDAPATRS